MDTAELRRGDLGDFLRRRRERIAPEQVGLVAGGRRRTPGLRREEVAQVAGVGVTWYTWLEQGRDIRASEQVLDAIARSLLLDVTERAHLFRLAGTPVAEVAAECRAVEPGMLRILERLGDYPALLRSARFDVLAYNAAYTGLIGDLAAVPFDQRNTLWLLFTCDAYRERVVEWETASRRCVAQFRAEMADHTGEPAWRGLVKRLEAASPEFTRIWADHEVVGQERVVKSFMHPDLALIRAEATTLAVPSRPGTRLLVYTPADERSAERMVSLPDVTPTPLLEVPAA